MTNLLTTQILKQLNLASKGIVPLTVSATKSILKSFYQSCF